MSTFWRPAQCVRPIAIGIVRRGDALLVVAVRDDAGDIKGWRPIGGTIAFGERAAEALQREFMEELGEAIENVKPVAAMENIYQHRWDTRLSSCSKRPSAMHMRAIARASSFKTAVLTIRRAGSLSRGSAAVKSGCFRQGCWSSSKTYW